MTRGRKRTLEVKVGNVDYVIVNEDDILAKVAK